MYLHENIFNLYCFFSLTTSHHTFPMNCRKFPGLSQGYLVFWNHAAMFTLHWPNFNYLKKIIDKAFSGAEWFGFGLDQSCSVPDIYSIIPLHKVNVSNDMTFMKELTGRQIMFLSPYYYRWKEWRSDTCAMRILIGLVIIVSAKILKMCQFVWITLTALHPHRLSTTSHCDSIIALRSPFSSAHQLKCGNQAYKSTKLKRKHVDFNT